MQTSALPAQLSPYVEELPIQEDHRPSGGVFRKGVRVEHDGISMITVEFHPVSYDPIANQVTWVESLSAEIRISGSTTTAGIQPLVRQELDLLNAEDARQWQSGRVTQPHATWFTPGSEALRVQTLNAGVYRIDRQSLLSAGVNPAGIDPRSFRLMYRGVEQPLLVTGEADGSFDDGDVIEFYAERKSGENGEYYDFWSDENVFFLLWGGMDGKRYPKEPATPSGEQPLASYIQALHLENDVLYHAGDSDAQGTMSEQVPGENWIWKYLLKKDTLVVPFSLQNLAQGDATLLVKLKHSSRDSSRVKLVLNGFELSTFDVGSLGIRIRKESLAQGILREGVNTLHVIGIAKVDCPPTDPNCSIERFYVDWVNIRYPSVPRALNGSYLLDARVGYDSSTAPQQMRVSIAGFQSADVRAINLSDGTLLDGIIVAQMPPHATDARVNSAKSYYFFGEEAVAVPRSLTRIILPDLGRTVRDVEYMIVTHSVFRTAAERLAEYRTATDGYATYVADVDEIYVEFNAGQKNPRAIRDFLRNTYEQSSVKPRFIVMMGDASWDPKYHLPNATRVDYVPSYGNPASDNYYVAYDSNPYDVTPFAHIGRIPAENLEQAHAVIDKIVEHEGTHPDEWNNRILYSIGGKSAFEQDLFKQGVNEQINTYLKPHCIDPRVIVKRKLDIVSYDDLDTLITEMNNGVLFYYFIGHGGTRLIDVGILGPEPFRTQGKYPLFITMSCNTAHFAEPYETGLNESFLLAKRNGSIASFGTSGLGVVGYDVVLGKGMFEALTEKGVRTYGELSTHAKKRLINETGLGNQITLNTVNQYIILGDPAAKVPLATTAELAVRKSEISTTPDVITQFNQTIITTRIRNFGLCLEDSVDVVLRIEQGGSEMARFEQRVPPFLHFTDVSWSHDFAGLVGTALMTVDVDPFQRIPENARSNNSVTVEINVLPRGITPVFPIDFARLNPGTIEFVVANPPHVPPPSMNPEVEIQLSRTTDFSALETKMIVPMGMVFTRISWTGSSSDETVFFWRSRLLTSEGSREWSETRTFTVAVESRYPGSWLLHTAPQMQRTKRDVVEVGSDGLLRLGRRDLELEIISAGNNNIDIRNFAEMRVGEWRYYSEQRGFHVLVLEPRRGFVVDSAVFDTYWTRDNSEAMAQFLKAVTDSNIVMIAVADDAAGFFPNITESLKSEMKALGALLIDSLQFRDSYALIGSRARPENTREQHLTLGAVFFKDTINVAAVRGWVSTPLIGPVRDAIQRVRWTGESGSAGARLDLAMVQSIAGRDSVLQTWSDVRSEEFLTPSLPQGRHPFVRLVANLQDTTGAGYPFIRSFETEYDPISVELGMTSQTVQIHRDSLLEGEPMLVTVGVHNTGIDAPDCRVRLSLRGSVALAMDTLVPLIRENASAEIPFVFPTVSLRGEIPFDVSVTGLLPEHYMGNNVFTSHFRVGKDVTRPVLNVTFDGVDVVNNDYVSPKPVIEIKLTDESPLAITDTSAVQMMLDQRRVWMIGNPQVQYVASPVGEEKISIRFTPMLTPGVHSFSVSAKDASNNLADSIPYQVRVYVSGEEKVDEIYPFPNPGSGPVEFTFRILGSKIPEEGSIKIYTIAGRMLKELSMDSEQLRIGFNRVRWDGRDADGDALANGVYFYKLSFTRDGKREEHIGRLAVLR